MTSFRLSDSSVDPTPCPTCGMPPINISALIEERNRLKAELEEARLKYSECMRYAREKLNALCASEALASERGAQVLTLREALGEAATVAFNVGYGTTDDNAKMKIRKWEQALTSTADAAERVRREILEGAWERVVKHCEDTGMASDLEFQGIRAAILGEDAPK